MMTMGPLRNEMIHLKAYPFIKALLLKIEKEEYFISRIKPKKDKV